MVPIKDLGEFRGMRQEYLISRHHRCGGVLLKTIFRRVIKPRAQGLDSLGASDRFPFGGVYAGDQQPKRERSFADQNRQEDPRKQILREALRHERDERVHGK